MANKPMPQLAYYFAFAVDRTSGSLIAAINGENVISAADKAVVQSATTDKPVTMRILRALQEAMHQEDDQWDPDCPKQVIYAIAKLPEIMKKVEALSPGYLASIGLTPLTNLQLQTYDTK